MRARRSNSSWPAPAGRTVRKAVLSFTEALRYESRDTGRRVLSLAPGLTRTAFFDGLNGGSRQGGYETPEQGVATAMRALGRGRRPSVQSGRLHALMVGLPRLFTRRRTVLLSGWITVRSSGAATVPAQGVVSEARDARRPACRLHR